MNSSRKNYWIALIVAVGVTVVCVVAFRPQLGGWLGRASMTAGTWRCDATNSMNVTQSTSYGGRSPFDARRIAVLCRSDHRMMKSAAEALVDKLAELPFVEAVELHHGRWPERFDDPPGVFVVLDLPAVSSSPAVGGMSITAKVSFTLSAEPWINRSHELHAGVPAMVRTEIDGTIGHRSTNRGVGTPGSVFDLPGKGIGEQIATNIAPALADLVAKHGLMPDLPGAFFGRGDDTDLRAELGALGFDHAVTYHPIGRDLLCYFTLTGEGDVHDVLTDLHAKLKAIGFEGRDLSDSETQGFRLRRQGMEDVRVLVDASQPSGLAISHDDLPEAARRALPEGDGVMLMKRSTDAETPRTYVLRYERFMPREHMTAAVEAFVDQADTADSLLMFWAQAADSPLREKLLAKLEAMPSMDAAPRLELASIYQVRDDHASARRHLRIAVVDMLAIYDDGDLKKKAKELAKKLGDESLDDFEPTADDLRQAGYTELPPGQPHQTVMTLDRTERFFCTDGDAAPLIAGLTISQAADLKEPYAVSLLLRPLGDGGSTHTRGGYDPADGEFARNHGYDNQNVRLHVRPNPDGEGFELTITAAVEKPQSPAP